MINGLPKAVKIFFSYAHEDEQYLQTLNAHLSSLKQEKKIAIWYDQAIHAGSDWANEINTQLDTADIILLLLSADFFSCEYCSSVEVQRALERNSKGEAHVIPIILRPVDWQNTQLGTLQALPHNGKAITEWPNPDQACLDVVQGIRQVVEELTEKHTRAPSSLKVSTLPYERNPFFTGREDILKDTHEKLIRNSAVAITQIQAISGLGGIGKTQTVLEYTYRYQNEYKAIFWLRAETEIELRSGFIEMAKLLNLPEQSAQNSDETVLAVKLWLESASDWLLIFDNADSPELLKTYRPHNARGHILLTSRAQVFDVLGIANPIEIREMQHNEALSFLFKRTGRDETNTEEKNAAESLAVELGYLPLALEQSCAYILEKKARFRDYLTSYRKHHLDILNKSLPKASHYPASVATTWAINFQEIEHIPASADLLYISAFLSPDSIPLELVANGASQLGPTLSTLLASVNDDPLLLNEILEPLTRYSLIYRDIDTNTFSIHRLVQEALKDKLDGNTKSLWAERVVKAVNLNLSNEKLQEQEITQRYLPHIKACAVLIEKLEMTFPEAIELLNRGGLYLQSIAEFKDSEQFFTLSLAINQKILEPHHLDLANHLSQLAWLYHDMGKFSEAEWLLVRALDIREKALEPDHIEVAESLNLLGEIRFHLWKYLSAEQLLLRSIAIMENTMGFDFAQLANPLGNLAKVYSQQAKYEQAEILFQRALTLEEKTLKPEDTNIAITLTNFATLYSEQRKYEQAEALYQRALTLEKKTLGPEHHDVTSGLYLLAAVYSKQRRYEQAEELFQQAVNVYHKTLGPNHPNFAICLLYMSDHYIAQSKYEQAKELIQKALQIRESALGPDHPSVADTLIAMGWFYHEQRKYSQAELHLVQARSILEKYLEPDEYSLIGCNYRLADIYMHQQKFARAEPLLIQAIAIAEKTLGLPHQEMTKNLKKLAELYEKQGNYNKAKSIYERILAIYKKSANMDPEKFAEISKEYAIVSQKTKQKRKASRK